jgi:hypothetical protein
LHLLYPTRLDLTLALHRIAEFYESPYPNIRGCAFSEIDFLRAYAKPTGAIDYFEYWDGFNVPAASLAAFLSTFMNWPLSDPEWEVLKAADQWREEYRVAARHGLPFPDTFPPRYKYLIATEVGSSPSTLPHELAHARWAIDPEYRGRMEEKLDTIPALLAQVLMDDLCRDDRYANDPDLLKDELQAYLSTASEEEMVETFPSLTAVERVMLSAAFS